MKIIIGTPIHISKDYAMEKWLENVSKLLAQTPADLLLVDNSPGIDPVISPEHCSGGNLQFPTSNGMNYVEKVKGYCAKYGITNYKIEHLELGGELSSDMRINVAQEVLRRKILASDYDAWFSWECDQLIPANTLDELIKLMEVGNCAMALHNCWARWDNNVLMTDMGCTLIKKECLEKAWFLPERDGKISLNESDRYKSTFKARVLRSGGSFIEAFGVIKPIYHLDK